jgi:Tol biopolymer transport system component
VVLYEMLTGKRLFHGETVSHTLADVLRADIDLKQLPPTTPPAIRDLLKRCLDRDIKTRLQVIGEARIANPAAEAESHGRSQAAALSRRGLIWPGVATVMTLAALTVSVLHFREKPPAPPASVRFQIRLPEKVSFTSSGAFTMSPDGRHAAFSAFGEDKAPRVWIQDLEALEARVLPDTFTGPNPPPFFWSPDGRFVVYSENSPRLKKADAQTGVVQEICEKPGPPIGGSWNKDGVIIFGSTSTGLWKVNAAGGTPAPLTKLDASLHERQHELPSFLSDGRHFLYLRSSAKPEESGIFAGSLDDPPERQSKKRILATQFGAYFAPSGEAGSGSLLFLREDVLMAQAFDPARLELSGNPAPLVRGVGSVYQTGFFSAAGNALLYRTSASVRDYQLTWFDREGKTAGTVGEPGSIAQVRVSLDGTHVAYRKDSRNLVGQDLWLLDLNRGTSARFTFGPGNSGLPLWSPDGSELIFSSDREGVFNLYRKPANGAREEEVLLRSNLNKWALSWSRDGKFLLYSASPSVVFSDKDGWVMPMQGDRTPYPFLQTRFDESGAKFSPDGRWVAYHSNETGRYEVYVREFTGAKDAATGGKWLVSKEGGTYPSWRDDGKELLYFDLGRKIMSLSIDATRDFQTGVPKELFQIPPGSNNVGATSDLKRFLIPVPVERKAPQAFTVLLNWPSALKP